MMEDKQVYRLGHVSFTVDSDDEAFSRELAKLLPSSRSSERIHQLRADDFRGLLSSVLELHKEYLWISAACLLSPRGRKVLISGQSNAGKSTTAAALALRYGWKVLSEDLTCIDTRTNKIIAFATPFSMKPGATELLQQAIGMQPEATVLGEWVPLNDLHVDGEYDLGFDLSLYFGEAKGGTPLQLLDCSAGEYVRLLLPCSNLIHDESRPGKLAEYLSKGRCHQVIGGSLEERLDMIMGLAEETVSSCCHR